MDMKPIVVGKDTAAFKRIVIAFVRVVSHKMLIECKAKRLVFKELVGSKGGFLTTSESNEDHKKKTLMLSIQ